MANTIQDKLTYLSGTKDAIKQAIIGKGVEVTDTDTFRSYADKISSIQAGGGGTVNLPDSTRFGHSTFTTVPTEIIPYLEQQTNLSSMFSYCERLTTVPHFKTSSVTDMSNMFYYCKRLTSVPLFDTSSVTSMELMFWGCDLLTTVPHFKTSSVNNMSGMFSGCESLQTVPLFDTSSVTLMSSMFSGCKKLQTVPQFDTSSVNSTGSMFNNCKSLSSVPLLNFSNVNAGWWMFSNCTSLTNLGGFTGLKEDLVLSSSPLLTTDSVMNVINTVADMTSSPRTLKLHKDVFNKLSADQIATASAKGWNIASA